MFKKNIYIQLQKNKRLFDNFLWDMEHQIQNITEEEFFKIWQNWIDDKFQDEIEYFL